MKKNKGFTLVELLAVIAILAIILLIAVPQILGVIADAEKGAFKNSVRSTIKAIELYYANDEDKALTGTMASLDVSGEKLTGEDWNIDATTGVVTLSNVTNGKWCLTSVSSTSLKDTDLSPVSGNCTSN